MHGMAKRVMGNMIHERRAARIIMKFKRIHP